jgi:hypothetical protein
MATSTYNLEADAGDVRGGGWVAFGGIVLGLAGIYNLIDGALAISKSKVYVAGAKYVFSDLHTWGWIVLVLGILQVVAAFAIFTGSEVARWFGVAAAGLNAIGQLMFATAYPLWSLALFAMDILVIYALTVYGGKKLKGQLY